jgi:hypothetical protein
MILIHDRPEEEEEQLKEEITSVFAMCFLESRNTCDWGLDLARLETPEFEDLYSSHLACFQRILKRYDVHLNLTELPEDRFNHLSQD